MTLSWTVGFRHRQAMGHASDGSLESTLARLTAEMADMRAEQERASGLAQLRADVAASNQVIAPFVSRIVRWI